MFDVKIPKRIKWAMNHMVLLCSYSLLCEKEVHFRILLKAYLINKTLQKINLSENLM